MPEDFPGVLRFQPENATEKSSYLSGDALEVTLA
jgi:hypothetical protein